jgi:dihydroorotate dehydrogenase electron transfer subunit
MTPFYHGAALVLENARIAQDTYRIRLEAPELAQAIRPGQFLMIRMASADPLLGRPFALFDTVQNARGIRHAVDVVYLVVGKLTGRLAQLGAGGRVSIWGPLGNGFSSPKVKHLGLVAGGIGQTPFLAFARQQLGGRGYGDDTEQRCVERVSIYYGVRSAAYFAGLEDFRATGAAVHLATDDGSMGFPGRVTQLLDAKSSTDRPDWLVGCGPEPMLRALASLALARGIGCQVSLETPMACGLGICFSCVAQIKTPDGWDYRRVCVDGPVFDAGRVVFAGNADRAN